MNKEEIKELIREVIREEIEKIVESDEKQGISTCAISKDETSGGSGNSDDIPWWVKVLNKLY